MTQYQMLEKGENNIELTTNVIKDENTIVLYKIYEDADDDNKLKMVDITEDDPDIQSIADDTLLRYVFDAPNEHCYLLTLFNGVPQFFIVGAPTIRVFSYLVDEGLSVSYTVRKFNGDVVNDGDELEELGNGVYYITPDDTGDYIVSIDRTPPTPLHVPYMNSKVGVRGKILFQKDKWMMLAVPIDGYTINDLVALVEDAYGVEGKDIFKIFSAYPATGEQAGEMLDFKPGRTPISSKYNFNLVYDDNGDKEITGFWCKTQNYDLEALGAGDKDELVEIEWNSNI